MVKPIVAPAFSLAPSQPGLALGGQQPYQMPRVPWGQNPMITTAAFGLLGGRSLNEGLQNVAQLAPAGLAAKTAMQRDMYRIQETNAARARKTAAFNAGIKAMSGLPLTPEEEAARAAEPEIALKFFELTQTKPTDDIREYEFAKSQGFTGTFQEWDTARRAAGATNVTVGGGKYGTIPPGLELVEGPNGAFLRKIPVENQAAQETKELKGGIVIEDIDRALAEVQANPNATTGLAGWAMGGLPIPSPARRVAGFLESIKSNISIDNLQVMREQSPTGGALGNVSDKDLAILQGVYGDLAQSTDAKTFQYNLKRLRNTYLDLVHGPGNGPTRMEITAPGPMNQPEGDYPAGTIIENDAGVRMKMGTDGEWRPMSGG